MRRLRITISLIIGLLAIEMVADDSVRQVYEEPDPAIIMQLDAGRYTHHWVATDALGRKVATYEEAGPKRKGKVVGVFYYIWLGYHTPGVYDLTRIVAENPDNPHWGPIGHFHFRGESEMGYYRSEDPWVIRRYLQMLSNADVDFIFFDVTNAVTYLETVKVLCEISLQMRREGIPTPEIIFLSNTNSGLITGNGSINTPNAGGGAKILRFRSKSRFLLPIIRRIRSEQVTTMANNPRSIYSITGEDVDGPFVMDTGSLVIAPVLMIKTNVKLHSWVLWHTFTYLIQKSQNRFVIIFGNHFEQGILVFYQPVIRTVF